MKYVKLGNTFINLERVDSIAVVEEVACCYLRIITGTDKLEIPCRNTDEADYYSIALMELLHENKSYVGDWGKRADSVKSW